MNKQEAEDIVETLHTYSAQTEYVLNSLEKYDYREEANDWHTPQAPKLLEPEHISASIILLAVSHYQPSPLLRRHRFALCRQQDIQCLFHICKSCELLSIFVILIRLYSAAVRRVDFEPVREIHQRCLRPMHAHRDGVKCANGTDPEVPDEFHEHLLGH